MQYMHYLKGLAAQQGFQIVSGLDDEECGWSCFLAGTCVDKPTQDGMDIFSCSPDGLYSFPAMGQSATNIAKGLSTNLNVTKGCDGPDSDQYALWEAGVPTVEIIEHDAAKNPHNDTGGSDTLSTIEPSLFEGIVRVDAAVAAWLVGISP
jgi:hypothetical protein